MGGSLTGGGRLEGGFLFRFESSFKSVERTFKGARCVVSIVADLDVSRVAFKAVIWRFVRCA